jgi:hypothetical protein
MPEAANVTLGEGRVRTKFNPSATSTVDQIKQKSAELIDLVEYLRQTEGGQSVTPGEKARLISLAETSFEEGAMWAVKAATFGL